jgi:hypothetical protein
MSSSSRLNTLHDPGRRRALQTTLAVAGLLGAAPRALRCAVAQTAVPEHIAAVIPGARLSGEGSFTYFVFHVYDARFYVGRSGFRSELPTATPFALDLDYARHFTGRAIAKTTLDEFERFNAGTAALRGEWYERLIKLLPDVEPGQHLTGVFLPGEGLRLYSNGALIGSDGDVQFARWFFAIWLDPRTRAPDLRAALLAGAGDDSKGAPAH